MSDTSGHAAPRHPTTDDLAEAAVGLRSDDSGLQRHIATCPACSAAVADLATGIADLGAALAALPEPEMPPDVWTRIEAGLAAEPLVAHEAAPRDPAAVAHLDDHRRRRRRGRWSGATAGLTTAAATLVGIMVLAPTGELQPPDPDAPVVSVPSLSLAAPQTAERVGSGGADPASPTTGETPGAPPSATGSIGVFTGTADSCEDLGVAGATMWVTAPDDPGAAAGPVGLSVAFEGGNTDGPAPTPSTQPRMVGAPVLGDPAAPDPVNAATSADVRSTGGVRVIRTAITGADGLVAIYPGSLNATLVAPNAGTPVPIRAVAVCFVLDS